MRPINLIPLEDRRGDAAPLRSGPAAYVIARGLVIVFVAVYAVVMTHNGITERETELRSLEAREQPRTAPSRVACPRVHDVHLAGRGPQPTVTTLASSRFDWERVLRELSLVIPEDVWLTQVTGSAGGPSTGGSQSSSSALAGRRARAGAAVHRLRGRQKGSRRLCRGAA